MAEQTQQSTVYTSAYIPADTDAAYKQVAQKKAGSEFKHNMFVLRSLVSRDFKLKYRRSVLGVAWSVLNPLLMMIILAIVFTYAFKFQIENFPLYLILGNILFDFMNRGTTGALESIIRSGSLIKKIRINKMIFPIEKVSFELVNFAISLIAAGAVLLFFMFNPSNGDTAIPAQLVSIHAIWGLPFIIVVVTIFACGLGLLISALAVFFRDMMHLWGVLMTAWTYFTPLFYPVEVLPEIVQDIMWFNPMYHYVTFFRSIMMWNTNPGGMESLICLGMALITFLVGWLVFRKVQSKFILYI